MMERSFLPFECGRHIMDNLCSCEGAFQKERIAMAVQKKESYIGEEESEIKSLPYLIRMAAGTKVLKEQLKTLKHF